jgi:hypothetical protein
MVFINETSLIFNEITNELTNLNHDLPSFLIWGIIFMSLYLFFTLGAILINKLSGSLRK